MGEFLPALRRPLSGALSLVLPCGLVAGALAMSCGQDSRGYGPRANPPAEVPDGGAPLFDGGTTGPPPVDAPGLCGNQLHDVVVDAPNVYFVLDNSGSMGSPDGAGGTRYDRVRGATVDLVRALGALINVGAALFPRHATQANSCRTGSEVFPVTPGTPSDPETGEDGPTTEAFRKATISKPAGGTPTAATLVELRPALTALPGRTIVVVCTDGGPNCNERAECSAEQCMPNLEGSCDPEQNCCAPGGPAGPASCVDEAATVQAIGALAAEGIDVYVVGIPGSEVYAGVLDEMAKAGGAAHASSPYYYRVDDLSEVSNVLGSIASVVVSCDFDLADPPPEEGLTNVYLDQKVLPYDALNGWTWKTSFTVQLHGDACARLKAGQVGSVQIVSGCPTEEPE